MSRLLIMTYISILWSHQCLRRSSDWELISVYNEKSIHSKAELKVLRLIISRRQHYAPQFLIIYLRGMLYLQWWSPQGHDSVRTEKTASSLQRQLRSSFKAKLVWKKHRLPLNKMTTYRFDSWNSNQGYFNFTAHSSNWLAFFPCNFEIRC